VNANGGQGVTDFFELNAVIAYEHFHGAYHVVWARPSERPMFRLVRRSHTTAFKLEEVRDALTAIGVHGPR